jgi:hypothetical protein
VRFTTGSELKAAVNGKRRHGERRNRTEDWVMRAE